MLAVMWETIYLPMFFGSMGTIKFWTYLETLAETEFANGTPDLAKICLDLCRAEA
jgi:hypothetical protein